MESSYQVLDVDCPVTAHSAHVDNSLELDLASVLWRKHTERRKEVKDKGEGRQRQIKAVNRKQVWQLTVMV